MKLKEYVKIVKKNSVKENKIKNLFFSFLGGGLIGIIGEIIFLFLNNFLNINDSYLLTTIIFVIAASIITGLGYFDKLVSIFKAGLIVPITGFAHSLTCAGMDHKKEGPIIGIGSNIFNLAGSIILYGIFFSVLFAFIKGVILS